MCPHWDLYRTNKVLSCSFVHLKKLVGTLNYMCCNLFLMSVNSTMKRRKKESYKKCLPLILIIVAATSAFLLCKLSYTQVVAALSFVYDQWMMFTALNSFQIVPCPLVSTTLKAETFWGAGTTAGELNLDPGLSEVPEFLENFPL